MSYFNDQSDNQQTTTPDDTTQSDDFVSKVKELKGDQWQDPNTLAKGYLTAQDHIKTLERQIAEQAEDLQKSKTAAEILEELKRSQAKPTSGEPDASNTGADDGNTSLPSAEDIKTLIDEALTGREKQATASQNLQEADRVLTERFGTEASKVVEAKAKELGLSKERLTEIASESPTAFLNLVGEPKDADGNTVTKSQVNTAQDKFSASNNERSWKWYQEMRRTNPKLYYSPKMQRQMEQDYASGKVQIN